MRDSFASLFRLSRGRGEISTVLQGLLGRSRWRALSARVPDRRDIVACAARELDWTEQELIDEIGSRLELSTLARIPEWKSENVPDFDLPLWQSAGACPLVSGGMLTGIVCVDPSLARSVLTDFPSLSICLASWNLIHNSLLHICPTPSERREEIDDEVLQSVLAYVFAEMNKHNAQSMQLHLQKAQPGYSFVSEQGGKARGELSAKLCAPLRSYLASRRILTIGAQEFFVRSDENQKDFLLSKQIKEESTPDNVVAFPNTKSTEPKEREGEGYTEPKGDREQTVTVLLVDDNVTFTRVLKRYLNRVNVECIIADTPPQAMEKLERSNQEIRLVICDVHMPMESGSSFLKRLKANSGFAHLPVIMLTSDDEIELHIQLVSDGADAFVRKSDDPRLLCAHVERLLAQHNLRKVA